jgi:hypothetical protein
VFYAGQWPSATLLAGVCLAALGSCAIGYFIFNRSKVLFAEIV